MNLLFLLLADAGAAVEGEAAATAASADLQAQYIEALEQVNQVFMNDGSILFSIPAVIYLVIWIFSGGFAIRVLPKVYDRFRDSLPYVNVAAMVAGPLVFIAWGLKVVLRKQIDQYMSKRRKEQAMQVATLISVAGQPLFTGGGDKLSTESLKAIDRVRQVVTVALNREAKDIMMDPAEGGKYSIRLKIGNELMPLMMVSGREGQESVNVFKTAGGMDTFENQRPQDGVFRARMGDRIFQLRVTSVGVMGGEKISARIKEIIETVNSLDTAGIPADELAAVKAVLAEQKGMILICGPEGSGKRTLTGFMLKEIDCTNKNAAWVGSGDEPEIPGVTRMVINVKNGMTAGALLQQAMTLDSDVVAITQIGVRDAIVPAVQMAAGGQMVIAGFDKRNAADAIEFLLRNGAEPRLLAAGLKLIISVRLIRKLCTCAQAAPLKPGYEDYFAQSGFATDRIRGPIGCRDCERTGYDGVVAVFDFVFVDDALRGLLLTPGVDPEQIRAFFAERHQDGSMMSYKALAMVAEGITSFDEVEQKILNVE